ncbi:hypothetical protein SKAU_G00030890 [Synaphobranchus kaupii]|uniref:Uncharacterized protein n=1 Tax=Synaphobranchus kaupii TaxID=118154 RepID=A0A9Q1GEX9_SYNKA|nr:hypothetical protein SKAU_G00030890 [Synaphobranchus kaupii]
MGLGVRTKGRARPSGATLWPQIRQQGKAQGGAPHVPAARTSCHYSASASEGSGIWEQKQQVLCKYCFL